MIKIGIDKFHGKTAQDNCVDFRLDKHDGME